MSDWAVDSLHHSSVDAAERAHWLRLDNPNYRVRVISRASGYRVETMKVSHQ